MRKNIFLLLLLFSFTFNYVYSSVPEIKATVVIDGTEYTNGFSFNSDMTKITYNYMGETKIFDLTKENYEADIKEWLEKTDSNVRKGAELPKVTPISTIVSNNIEEVSFNIFHENIKPVIAVVEETPQIQESTEKLDVDTKKDEEDKKTKADDMMIRRSEIRADVSGEWFKMYGQKGTLYKVFAQYMLTTPSETWSYGGRIGANMISFDEGADSQNYVFTLSLKRLMSESQKMTNYLGGNVNYILVDDNIGDDNVAGINFYYNGRNYFENASVLSYGIMYNHNKMGDENSNFINLALGYGMPIGKRYSINLGTVYSRNIEYEGETLNQPDILNVEVMTSVYFTEYFGLNVGVNTVLLAEDYESVGIVLGSNYMF